LFCLPFLRFWSSESENYKNYTEINVTAAAVAGEENWIEINGHPAAKTTNQLKSSKQTNNKGQLFDGCTCISQCNCNFKRNHKLWQVQDAAGRRCTTFQVSNETSSTSATSFRICCGSQLSVLCSEPLFGAHHFLRSFASQTSNLAN